MAEQDTPKMTHDEMIDVLKGLVFGTFDRTTTKEREALDIAIKALENEDTVKKMFRNGLLKDCEMCKMHQKPQTDVLDKIRAEIEDLDRFYDNDYFSTNHCPMYKCNEVLQIIDKYKAES